MFMCIYPFKQNLIEEKYVASMAFYFFFCFQECNVKCCESKRCNVAVLDGRSLLLTFLILLTKLGLCLRNLRRGVSQEYNTIR